MRIASPWPAAGADRGQAEAAAVAAQLVGERREDARAGGADRMAECDGAAVHVTRSGSASSSSVECRTTEENASFNSIARRRRSFSPARSSALSPARAGVRASQANSFRDRGRREDRGERLQAAPLRERVRGDDDRSRRRRSRTGRCRR